MTAVPMTASASAGPSWSVRNAATAAVCLFIIAVGAILRLVGTDWDEGANLHPDERHMMFVAMDTMRAFDALKPGELSLGETWFAADKSPLDPRRNDRIYVYGEFPHIVVSLVSRIAGGGWPEILQRARVIGSIVDGYTILAVFLLSSLIFRNAAASLGAAALYAFLPLAIQQSNFFAVDTWLTAATAWCTLASTMIVKARDPRTRLVWVGVAGGVAGLALACKLPGLILIGTTCVAVMVRFWADGPDRRNSGLLLALVLAIGSFGFAFRLASPFTFEGPGLFGLVPTAKVLAGYEEMTSLVVDFGFPPNWQWMAGYGPGRALLDLALWGTGLPIALAIAAGLGLAARCRRDWPALLPLLSAVVAFFGYWFAVPTPALRYVLPALPLLCVIAGPVFSALLALRRVGAIAAALGTAVVCVWGLGMVTLHTTTNSRVAGSRWLWLNTSPGVVVANESAWDDGLPVPVRLPGGKGLTWGGQENHFTYLTLGLEAPDTPEKGRTIAALLDRADLLILSSERLRRPIVALSGRFPLTATYYAMLEDGRLCFEPVYRDLPGYPLIGFRLNDRGAQEPWSVYDHPTVEIYRKLPCYDRQRIETTLVQALSNG